MSNSLFTFVISNFNKVKIIHYKSKATMNPFIQNFKLKVIEIYSEQKYINSNDLSDGIATKYRKETSVFFAERQEKTAVYEIPYIENVLFKEMSSCGRDLLLYIIYNIQKNEDFINLKHDKVCKEMQISKPTLIKAINNLEENAIVCKKSQSEYWINPMYIFKGNRIAYYQKNCEDCIEIVSKLEQKS